ncbi:MAG: NAD(P)H-binding protein, partial [Roseicyclus sp.]
RLYLRLFLGALMDDKERQEALLKATDLDYLLVQPVALTDGPATGTWSPDPGGRVRKQQVSRADMAAFIVSELEKRQFRRQTVAFSG